MKYKIPKLIYEVLPILWVCGGIIAIVKIESFIAFVSGILLAGSGVVIWLYRNTYREKQRKNP